MARRDAKTKSALSACPRCRLLHGTAALCRHCGDVSPRPLDELIERPESKRLARRVPSKRGWRWFDLVFFVLLVAGPLEVERRAPGFFAAAFGALTALWALFRLAHYLLTHYRLVSERQAARVTAMAKAVLPGAAPLCEGRARKLKQTVDAVSLPRRCLVSELRLESTDGSLRLRQQRAVPFAVETARGPVRVEGVVRLLGDAEDHSTGARARELWGQDLPGNWFEGAAVGELLVRHNDKLRLWGGTLREATAGERLLEGSAGNAIQLWRER